MSDSIYGSNTDDDSYEIYIIMNALEEIQDVNHVHPDMNAIYDRLKIGDRSNQALSECKGE